MKTKQTGMVYRPGLATRVFLWAIEGLLVRGSLWNDWHSPGRYSARWWAARSLASLLHPAENMKFVLLIAREEIRGTTFVAPRVCVSIMIVQVTESESNSSSFSMGNNTAEKWHFWPSPVALWTWLQNLKTLSLLDLFIVFSSYFDQTQRGKISKKIIIFYLIFFCALVVYFQHWFVFERLFLSNV